MEVWEGHIVLALPTSKPLLLCWIWVCYRQGDVAPEHA